MEGFSAYYLVLQKILKSSGDRLELLPSVHLHAASIITVMNEGE